MTAELIDLIEEKLCLDWSSEQVSCWLITKKKVPISHERIYQHVLKDKRQGRALYKYLCRQAKKHDKRRNGKSTRGRLKIRLVLIIALKSL
jgi:IS30 family transposase